MQGAFLLGAILLGAFLLGAFLLSAFLLGCLFVVLPLKEPTTKYDWSVTCMSTDEMDVLLRIIFNCLKLNVCLMLEKTGTN